MDLHIHIQALPIQGRIQDFKLGGGALKKLRRAEGGAKIFGVFRVKNHDFTQKKKKNPILGGAPCAPPSGSTLAITTKICQLDSCTFRGVLDTNVSVEMFHETDVLLGYSDILHQ